MIWIAARQDPDASCQAQEQNAQVNRVEPHLKNVFHHDFSFPVKLFDLTFPKNDKPSPTRGDWEGD
jgi:hypothetical protein